MRRWLALTAAVVLLVLLVAGDKTGGCGHFNRMGISPDGNTVAFSLNEEGGFLVDDTSALYKLDLATCELTRVSGDRPIATWADVNGAGDVLFTWRGEESAEFAEVAVARADGTIEELTRNRISDVAPQWLDEKRILLATTPPLPGRDEYEVILTILDNEGKAEEVARDLYAESGKRAYWSTLPVWSGERLVYAVREVAEEEAVKEGAEAKVEEAPVHFYLSDLSTGERREITTVVLVARGGGSGESGFGFVDLAVSPDGKKLAACFLPEEFEEDEQPSQLYLIDLETAKHEVVKDDVNMYYPRFAPEDEGEPSRLLYLSGTGEEGTGRSINVLDLKTRQARKIVSLPGKIMCAYTDWRWLCELAGAEETTPRDRLRVYHLSDLGLIVAEVNSDGTDLSVRYLSAPQLRRAQLEADVRWAKAVAQESAEQSADLQEALSHAKELVPEGVGFVTVESVPPWQTEKEAAE